MENIIEDLNIDDLDCEITNQYLYMMAKKMEENYPRVISNVSLPSLNLDDYLTQDLNAEFNPSLSIDTLLSELEAYLNPSSFGHSIDQFKDNSNQPRANHFKDNPSSSDPSTSAPSTSAPSKQLISQSKAFVYKPARLRHRKIYKKPATNEKRKYRQKKSLKL
ncbi:uncharacterized protein LOC123300092 [Chrysoperla carnea]|uniref:uncharacterized protein LOC123300092 n=1 Tax=Chrysoperla carnea TaxID=189513 RepID=UPI001D08D9C9|nr:uncharacterized protein LOC123300092 [Chrysoperla carnea]